MSNELEHETITSDDVASLTEVVTPDSAALSITGDIDVRWASGVIERDGSFDFECHCGFRSVRHETEESAQARAAEHLAEHCEGDDATSAE